MAILKLENTAPEYNGRLDGNIVTSFGLRGVSRVRVRPASSLARQHWKPPFGLSYARAAYAGLSAALQEDWETYAAANITWPIQGSPRYAPGELCFANYYTVLRLIDPLASIPDVPLGGPTWQPQPKFFEFATWESGIYTIKAETEFAVDTQILFSGLPPSPTVFNGQFFGEKIVGSHVFDFGLTVNEEYDGLHYMIEDEFGTITDTDKIWGRLWEVENGTGHIRVLKDPCTPDPETSPPTTGLTILIDNGWDSEIFYTMVIAYDDTYTDVGGCNIMDIPAMGEAEGDIEFNFGYSREDVASLEFYTAWHDYETGFDYTTYDDSDPFEWTVMPM